MTARTGAPNSLRLIVAAFAMAFIAYAVVVGIARDLSLQGALIAGLANAIATVLVAIPAYRASGWLVGRPLARQIAGHVLIGGAYAFGAYWLLIVVFGVLFGASLVEFTVTPFPGRSSVWQLLENLTTYGIVATLAYLYRRPEAVTLILSEGTAGIEPALSRYFIRSGDDILPIDVNRIISIAGADDYAEVATPEGRHLVRMTLTEFEQALDPARFIRIHRSRIVNLDHVERAEPAGDGRLLLHMGDGETIRASRAGSRLLKDRVL